MLRLGLGCVPFFGVPFSAFTEAEEWAAGLALPGVALLRFSFGFPSY